MNIKEFTIPIGSTVIEALKKIDTLDSTQTLFALDKFGCLKGTITDGDIRRGFINGLDFKSPLSEFICSDFNYLIDSEENITKLKTFRKLNLKAVPLINKNKELIKVYDFSTMKSVLPIDAVIMAGGKGERLRPLTNSQPKPMLPLGDKPIIEHNIDRLISFGVENIYISVNYLSEQIIDYFGDGSSKGINIYYLQEESFLGTIGSVSMVSNFRSPYVLVMNSDLFTDVDFEDMLLNLEETKADLSVASIPYTVNVPFAIMNRENGRITGLKEKPSNTHYANAGIYLMKREIIDRIPQNAFYNATDLIEDLITNEFKVIDNPITGYWIDIGRHEDYNKAKEIIKHISGI
jgi:dTDP-glucose pyrophosphorylase